MARSFPSQMSTLLNGIQWSNCSSSSMALQVSSPRLQARTKASWRRKPDGSNHSRIRSGCSSSLVAKGSGDSSPPPESASAGERALAVSEQLAARGTDLFPLWVLCGAVTAAVQPNAFSWFSGPVFQASFFASMSIMGLTLDEKQIKEALLSPGALLIGCACQYTIMPILGKLTSTFLATPEFAMGTILVACCPGGAASNLVSLLAGGDVALSVLMTATSTVAASVATPLLFKFLASGATVSISAWNLMANTAKFVLAPLAVGFATKRAFPRLVSWVLPFCPIVAVLTVALICASIIGDNAHFLRAGGFSLPIAIMCLHAAGFAMGYFVPFLLRLKQQQRRTMSIEVGMQNSALGVMLALSAPDIPNLAALPCAISATVHSCIGSLVATIFRYLDNSKRADILG